VGGISYSSVSEFVREFDSELVALELSWMTPIFDVYSLRESPTLASTGITRVEGGCYEVCPAVVLPMRISSFFDVFTELSISSVIGSGSVPASGVIRLVQVPEPASSVLAALVVAGCLTRRRSATCRLSLRRR
jgi:hypothetical protein